jgi:1-deoxy-D-xylulose 5-phosphate reductoisomerase
MAAGGAACCMLNAANEEAVFRLLGKGGESMPIGRIFDVVEETLQRIGSRPADTEEQVFAADAEARRVARQLLAQAE